MTFLKLSNKFEHRTKSKSQQRADKVYAFLVLVLAICGSAAIFSAGYAYADFRYDDAFYFIKRQTIWLLLGLFVMLGASFIKREFLKILSPYLYGITLALLLLVLAIGLVGNGAKRWISIGPLTIQPSEICKLTLVLMLSYYFSSREKEISDRRNERHVCIYGTVLPFLIIFIPIFLVMLQKHLSCIIILGAIGLLLIFISGINPKYLYFLLILGICAVSALALFTDYTKERITVWRNPEAYSLTGGWQTLQGLMAIGSGGLFGVGFGKSVLKYSYVSEPANDMVFAIVCEEIGFFGACAILLTFAFLVGRGLFISLRVDDTYSKLVAAGISIKMAIQVLLNIGVVTNTIPNTGISLPFFSYGGSSLIMIFLEMGIMLSISKKARIKK